MDERIALSPREEHRLHVVRMSLEGRITIAEAARLVGLSRRQVLRLRRRVTAQGRAGMAHGNRGRPPIHRTPARLRQQALRLARGKYAGLNDSHLTEKLQAEGLALSRATLQRLLRAAGLSSPRRRRPPRHRRRRPRRPQAGLLLQLDGSPCAWFGAQAPACSLLAAVDDATGAVVAAGFRAEEDAAGYFTLLRTITRTVGLPGAVYTDQHGIFVRNDPHWTRDEELAGAQEPTHVGRALQALGIAHLVAKTPQAKGRIEKLFNTWQDRLVAELRLAGITTRAAGDAFLATTFLPAYNAQFAVPPADAAAAYRPVPRAIDLDRVWSFHYAATVLNDNTVRLAGRVLDIPPGPARRSYARARVEVCQLLDGSWRVYFQDRLLATAPPEAPADARPLRALRRPRSHRDPAVHPLPTPGPSPGGGDIFTEQLR